MRLKSIILTVMLLPVLIFAQSWNCELIGQLDYSQLANDIWGYVASDGTEYALVGTSSGTSIVDVSTDESNPTEVAFISGQNSTWRDVKTYDHYMYVSTEASQGIQVVDIQDPPNAQLVYTWDGVSGAHNIFQADGYLYVIGASGYNMHILDLSNPAQPEEVGGWNGEYLHDVYVRGDYAYGCGIYSSTMYIIDISDKTNPFTVTSWSYSGAAHACWLSEDGNYLITADETSGGHIKIWDVSDFGNINMVSEWMADGDRASQSTTYLCAITISMPATMYSDCRLSILPIPTTQYWPATTIPIPAAADYMRELGAPIPLPKAAILIYLI